MFCKVAATQAEAAREAAALRAFAGYGVCRLISYDDRTLVLERAVPGDTLRAFFPDRDAQACEIIMHALARLHHAPMPPKHRFPHVRELLATLDAEWAIPASYLAMARELRTQLLETAAPDVLLHGDLHHDNIVKEGDAWLVIDPKGGIGEPAYDAGAFIRNPLNELIEYPHYVEIIRSRITYFARELHVSEQRIADWCFVQAVVAWCWAIEDGLDTLVFERHASVFYQVALSKT